MSDSRGKMKSDFDHAIRKAEEALEKLRKAIDELSDLLSQLFGFIGKAREAARTEVNRSQIISRMNVENVHNLNNKVGEVSHLRKGAEEAIHQVRSFGSQDPHSARRVAELEGKFANLNQEVQEVNQDLSGLNRALAQNALINAKLPPTANDHADTLRNKMDTAVQNAQQNRPSEPEPTVSNTPKPGG